MIPLAADAAFAAAVHLYVRVILVLLVLVVVKLAYLYATKPLPRRRRTPPPIDVAAVWVPLYIPRGCEHETKHPVRITVNNEPMLVAWICANARCAESGVYSRWIAYGTGEPETRHAAR